MKTIEQIRDAFHLIHRVATGQSDRGYMSIPADPERDADLIVAAAIDELERVRAEAERWKSAANAVDVGTLRAERDALKAQVVELEAEVVSWRATARDKGESSRKAAAERDSLRAQVEAWEEKAKVWLMSPEAAKHLDGYRELGEKCARLLARVAELEAKAVKDDAHALVVNDAHLKTVAALRGRVAWLEAQWGEAVAALRDTTEALEGSFPGDESVGLPEFPEVSLSEAWKRREHARAVLAKHPEGR